VTRVFIFQKSAPEITSLVLVLLGLFVVFFLGDRLYTFLKSKRQQFKEGRDSTENLEGENNEDDTPSAPGQV